MKTKEQRHGDLVPVFSKSPIPDCTIRFKDCGQDFLEWDIVKGKVHDCRPFQASVWCGLDVASKAIKRGGFLTVYRHDFKAKASDVITIKYPVTRITSLAVPAVA